MKILATYETNLANEFDLGGNWDWERPLWITN